MVLNWPYLLLGSRDLLPSLRIDECICQKADDFEVSGGFLACKKVYRSELTFHQGGSCKTPQLSRYRSNHKWKIQFSNTNLSLENCADFLTECFSLQDWRLKHSVETSARFSKLKLVLENSIFRSCRSQLKNYHFGQTIVELAETQWAELEELINLKSGGVLLTLFCILNELPCCKVGDSCRQTPNHE